MINFSGASLLGYQQNYEYFGDVFQYRLTRNISIKGWVLALDNAQGIAPVWTGISGLLSGAVDYDDIILNDISFGAGRVESLEFSDGNDVRKKDYTANLTCYESGDLSNLSGELYSGIDPSYYNKVLSMEEKFSFQDGQGLRGYEHNLSIQLSSGDGAEDPKVIAKSIAQNLFNNKITKLIDPNFVANSSKYYLEAYNAITNQCSFTEKARYNQINLPYSFDYSHSLDLKEDGITNISEKGIIMGLSGDRISAAYSGYSEQETLIPSRCSGIFGAYNAYGFELFGSPISTSKQVDTFGGKIIYQFNYSNDPRLTGDCSWDYSQQLNKETNGVYTIGEEGSIMGIGKKEPSLTSEKLLKAINFWSGVSSGLLDRAKSFSECTYLNMTESSTSIAEFRGTIQYSRQFTSDPTISSGVIRKITSQFSDSIPIDRYNSFALANRGDIEQPASVNNLGKRSISIDLVGERSASFSDFYSAGLNAVQNNPPTGEEVILESLGFSVKPLEGLGNVSASYTFTRL